MNRLDTRTSVVLYKFEGALAEAASGRHRGGCRVADRGSQRGSQRSLGGEEADLQTEEEGDAGPGGTCGGPQGTGCVKFWCVEFHRPDTSPRGAVHLGEAQRREAVTTVLDTRLRGVDVEPAGHLAPAQESGGEESEGQECSPWSESDGEGRTRDSHELPQVCALQPSTTHTTGSPTKSTTFRSSWPTPASCRMHQARSCSQRWT